MSKSIKYSMLVIAIIIFMITIFLTYFYVSTRNTLSGKVYLQGLKHAVTISRDNYGIPYIRADNDDDAFFALGFVHAQDRFWQMEFQRHIFKGTLSEIFGEATIEQDKFLRTIGFYRAAKKAWPALSPQSQRIIYHYTNGVNSYLKTGKLPVQLKILNYSPDPWREVDSIAWQKMMAWDLQSTWQEKITNQIIASTFGKEEISTLLPDYPKNAPTILHPQNIIDANLTIKDNDLVKLSNETLIQTLNRTAILNQSLNMSHLPGKGSNNWVISGKLTDSKKPLLASDPHLGLSSPNLWYIADIKTPHLHLVGATIPGLPALIIGHNDYISWGITNACVDAQDLYIENEHSSFKFIDETIKIKNKPSVKYRVHESEHGPIISGVTSAGKIHNAIALKWPALLPNDTTLQSFIELGYAKNWSEFQQALSYYITPSQNFVYADTAGNIGYYLSGKVPIRNGGSGAFPMPANLHFEWQGYIPFKKMPHIYNPKEGYIVTANNKITPTNYPYSLGPRCEVTHHRAQRIIDLIKNKPSLSIGDMAKIQNDTVNLVWYDLKDFLLSTKPLNKNSEIALSILKTWEGNMSLESIGATVFSSWFKKLSELMPPTIRDYVQWTSPYFIKKQLSENGKYCRVAQVKNCDEFLSQSLNDSILEIIQRYGENPNNWQWGNVHRAKFNDIGLGTVSYLGWIWNKSIPSPGDAFTINVGTYDFKNFNQIAGAGYRQIIDLGDLSQSIFIQVLGQSSDRWVSNYSDQLNLWQKGNYIPSHFPDKITYKLVLYPSLPLDTS